MLLFKRNTKLQNEVNINNESKVDRDSVLLHHIIELKESVATIKGDVKIITSDIEKIKSNIKTLFGKVKR